MNKEMNIIITGASSGIGAALARAYAAPGVTLGLMGRSKARLTEVAYDCLKSGAKVETGVVDVRDNEIMQEWLEHFDASHPIDLLIANAGISAGAGGKKESQKMMRDIFATNVNGVINSVLPVVPPMQERGAGQIAIMSSLAGIRGLPSCPAYSASKAAVKAFGEGLRGELKDDGITVSVICPGFIRTPLTDVNPFPMPYIMEPEDAAKIIMRGLKRNKSCIAFPLKMYLPIRLMSCLPYFITDPFFAALPKKNG